MHKAVVQPGSTRVPGGNREIEARRTSFFEQPAWICVLLFGAIALVFWPVHAFDFVNYDDPDYVSSNPHVQSGVTAQNLAWSFTSGHASNWHPLTWFSHMLDCQVFGVNPGAMHLVNVAFHALNSILLFLLLRRMTGYHWGSALVAGIFGLHPLRVESVAWISERKDVLSGLFLLLTLAAYDRYVTARRVDSASEEEQDLAGAQGPWQRPKDGGVPSAKQRWLWYTAALACFALGLMSKPMLVTLPFLLVLLDYWPLERFRLQGPELKTIGQLLLEKAPFFIVAAAAGVVTFLVQRHGGAVSTSLPFTERVANALVSYIRYLAKTVWPIDLSVLYPHPGRWPAWEVVSSTVVLIGITVAAIVWARSHAWLAVGWFWFVGALVPVIGLVQVGMQSMADRYTYVPSIGLLIAVVWSGAHVLQRTPDARPMLSALAIICLLMLSAATAYQVRFWHDSQTLFSRAIQVTTNNYLAYNNLGFYFSGQGRLQEAKDYYQKSISINPLYADALNNYGYALAGEKKFSEAIPYYERALRVNPNQPEIHNNLGNALSELGKLGEAIAHYEIVLKQLPNHADAHNNLGIALAMQGKLNEAIGHFRAALQAKPAYASAHSNLGNALAAQNQIPEAIQQYQECLSLNPKDAQAHNNLANALVSQGHLDEAVEHYRQALQLNPQNPEAHFNLGIVLLRQNNKQEAATHFQQALQLNPANAEARRQLQLLSAGN